MWQTNKFRFEISEIFAFLKNSLTNAKVWFIFLKATVFYCFFVGSADKCLPASRMSYSRRDRESVSGRREIPHTRIEDERQIEDSYKFGKELGRGSFGVVKEATHRATGKRLAVKAVNKEKVCTVIWFLFVCFQKNTDMPVEW